MSSPTFTSTDTIRPNVDWAKIIIYVVLIIGAAVAILPFLATISMSLMNLTEVSASRLTPVTPQWGNYPKAWEEAELGRYFTNSVKIALIVVVGEVVFSTLAAYVFARMEFPGKNLIFGLMLATLTLPAAIVWVPNFLTVSWLGKVTPIQWIDNWPALTIPFMASAFGIFLLRQFFQQIPTELWDAAQIDGAGHLRFLSQIVLPLSKAPIMVLIVFSISASWNELAWPILVTTLPDWRPISYALKVFVDEERSRANLQMAGALITMLPIVFVYFLTQKQFIEGMTRSGLKG